jgi:hypothetical protein
LGGDDLEITAGLSHPTLAHAEIDQTLASPSKLSARGGCVVIRLSSDPGMNTSWRIDLVKGSLNGGGGRSEANFNAEPNGRLKATSQSDADPCRAVGHVRPLAFST